MQGTKNASWYIVLHKFHLLLHNWPRALHVNVWCQYSYPFHTKPSSRMHLRQGDAWAGLWKANEGIRAGKGTSALGRANIPQCLIAALLLILFSAWCSFSNNPDPLKSYPSANKAIILDFFDECAPDLLLTHLVDNSLVRVSLVYEVVFIHFHLHKYAHTCMHMNRNLQGFQNASYSWSRYFIRPHK